LDLQLFSLLSATKPRLGTVNEACNNADSLVKSKIKRRAVLYNGIYSITQRDKMHESSSE